MTLAGRYNWWAPAPLRRLHTRLGLSETATRMRTRRRYVAAGRS
jgi:RND superfamily putative drug exporter